MTAFKIFFFTLLFAFITNIQAQISHGGKPFPYYPVKSPAPRIVLQGFDIERAVLKSLSKEATEGKKPLEFAWNHEVDLTPENSGLWTHWNGGIKTWRIEIVSPGAFAVNVYFGKFRLRNGCMLFAYSPDQSRVLGGFNEKNNLAEGQLPLAFIPGESLVVELQVPEEVTDFGELQIHAVAHDYINVFGRKDASDNYYGKSGECNVDINCPEGADWQVVKRAVCRITVKSGSSTSLCSGALINTTHNDSRPYLITANHCIKNGTNAVNSVFYFDYESPSCSGPDDTTTVYTLSGSNILATSDSLDFSLIKLSTPVPLSYKPYYAGWTTSSIPATSVVCIHHPEGDVKKISIEEHPVTSEYQTVNLPSWLVNESVPGGFWRVRHWETGTTEGGSSGAPLYNQRGKIVGNLTGGDAVCSNSINDYFSKFYMQWNYYPDSSRQLKCWLDSINAGVSEINGSEPIDTDTIKFADRFVLYPNPANDFLTFESDSLDIQGAIISIYSMDGKKMAAYSIHDTNRIILNVSFLNQGLYIFEYRNKNIIIFRKLLIIR
jgi:lysyl endopeptidase